MKCMQTANSKVLGKNSKICLQNFKKQFPEENQYASTFFLLQQYEHTWVASSFDGVIKSAKGPAKSLQDDIWKLLPNLHHPEH